MGALAADATLSSLNPCNSAVLCLAILHTQNHLPKCFRHMCIYAVLHMQVFLPWQVVAAQRDSIPVNICY
jgi:hypothetical protein